MTPKMLLMFSPTIAAIILCYIRSESPTQPPVAGSVTSASSNTVKYVAFSEFDTAFGGTRTDRQMEEDFRYYKGKPVM